MVNLGLVGRCGLYCGTCGIYRGYKDGGVLLEQMAERWNIPREKIRCNGCSALTPDCWGMGCEIIKCLDSKGYKFCFECTAFDDRTCEKYEKIAARYLKRGEDIRESLVRINVGEAEEWLEEQDKRWRCSSCGEPVSVHAEKCYNCGASWRLDFKQ